MSTFCLIHGSWHDGSSWDLLIDPLRSRGHEAVAPDLPIDDPGTSWEDRVEPVLRALDDVDGQVVIVAHSGSSGYGALAAARVGNPLLVHLCPRLGEFDPPSGAPAVFRTDFPFPASRADGASAWEREAAIEAMYPRLPRDAAERLADRLRPTTTPSGDFPLGGHPDIATVVVCASEDEFFVPAWPRFMAARLLGVEAIEIPGGHFPMVEDPEGLADLLDRLARERQAPDPRRQRGVRAD